MSSSHKERTEYWETFRAKAGDEEELFSWMSVQTMDYLVAGEQRQQRRGFPGADVFRIFPFGDADDFSLLEVPLDVLSRLLSIERRYLEYSKRASDNGIPATTLVETAEIRLWSVHNSNAVARSQPSDRATYDAFLGELQHLEDAGANLRAYRSAVGGFTLSHLMMRHIGYHPPLVARAIEKFNLDFEDACENHFKTCIYTAWLVGRNTGGVIVDTDPCVWQLYEKIKAAHRATPHCVDALNTFVGLAFLSDFEFYCGLMERGHDPLLHCNVLRPYHANSSVLATCANQPIPVTALARGIVRMWKTKREFHKTMTAMPATAVVGSITAGALQPHMETTMQNHLRMACDLIETALHVDDWRTKIRCVAYSLVDINDRCLICTSTEPRAISMVELLVRVRFLDAPEEFIRRVLLRATTCEQLNVTWPVECHRHDITGIAEYYNTVTGSNDLLSLLVYTETSCDLPAESTHRVAKALLECGLEIPRLLYRYLETRHASYLEQQFKTKSKLFELFEEWRYGRMRVRRSWSNLMKWLWVAHLKSKESPFYCLPRDLMRYVVDFLYCSGSLETAQWAAPVVVAS